MDDIAEARYISLTTFTRDGTPKATPVWMTGTDGTYRFYTGADCWKIKRLRNNSTVEIRVCDMRGRIEPHTAVHHGTGHVLDDDTSLAEVRDAVLGKYRWQARLVLFTDMIKERLGKGENPIAVQIDIPHPQPPNATPDR